MEKAHTFNTAVHGLRGVASMMVFYAHLLGGAAEHVYTERLGYVEGIVPFWNFGTYGVYLFFAISGFVILPSVMRYSLKEFAVRRFWRIYPIFLVFTVIFIAANYATNLMPELNDPLTVLSALTFLNLLTGTEQLTPNAWSLTYEIMFYTLSALLAFFCMKQPNKVGAIIAIILCIAFVVRFPAALFFLIGAGVRLMYQYDWVLQGPMRSILECASLITLVAISSQGHFGYYQSEMSDPVALGTIAATALYFYFAVDHNSLTGRVLNRRWVLYLGTVSYSLYLVHPYVYLPIRLMFIRMGWFTDDIPLSLVVFIVSVSIPTLIATHITHVLFERWPYRRLFKREVFSPLKKTSTEFRSTTQ